MGKTFLCANTRPSACKVITIASRKGGVGKSTTTVSLCAGLARQTKDDGSPYRVLAIDTDSQYSLGVSLGVSKPDKLGYSLSNVMQGIMNEQDIDPLHGIVRHEEGVDLLPSNTSLTAIELALVSVIGRETILKQYIEMVRPYYDFVVIDTSPSLDLMTINAFACADSVIVPIAPRFLDAKGLEALLKNVAQIRRQINPPLEIMGILMTMVDHRTLLARDIMSSIEAVYGSKIRIFGQSIPVSVKASEASANGVSIFKHAPKNKVAMAYASLTQEVIDIG